MRVCVEKQQGVVSVSWSWLSNFPRSTVLIAPLNFFSIFPFPFINWIGPPPLAPSSHLLLVKPTTPSWITWLIADLDHSEWHQPITIRKHIPLIPLRVIRPQGWSVDHTLKSSHTRPIPYEETRNSIPKDSYISFEITNIRCIWN